MYILTYLTRIFYYLFALFTAIKFYFFCKDDYNLEYKCDDAYPKCTESTCSNISDSYTSCSDSESSSSSSSSSSCNYNSSSSSDLVCNKNKWRPLNGTRYRFAKGCTLFKGSMTDIENNNLEIKNTGGQYVLMYDPLFYKTGKYTNVSLINLTSVVCDESKTSKSICSFNPYSKYYFVTSYNTKLFLKTNRNEQYYIQYKKYGKKVIIYSLRKIFKACAKVVLYSDKKYKYYKLITDDYILKPINQTKFNKKHICVLYTINKLDKNGELYVNVIAYS